MGKKIKAAQDEILAEQAENPEAYEEELVSPVNADKAPVSHHTTNIRRRLQERNEELDALREKIEELGGEGAIPNYKIDPYLIGLDDTPNRTDAAFNNEDYVELVESIQAAGGNRQPIKIRPRFEDELTDLAEEHENGQVTDVDYVLVYGERRLRACREIGISVWAVFDKSLDLEGAIVEQVAENEQRADLTPYEQARKWSHALDVGAFSSHADFARRIGVSKALISRRLSIMELPELTFTLAGDPSYINGRRFDALIKANREDPDHYLDCVQHLYDEHGPATTAKQADQLMKDVCQLFAEKWQTDDNSYHNNIFIDDELVCSTKFNPNGTAKIEIPKGVIEEEDMEDLEAMLREFFESRDSHEEPED
ncbi:ParB/RepB/Spo0J family partition protein [Halorhodospira halochloris]|uniref:ParB/RepB/Spo0J family partition protein n=1 Tax=Halorhodospira halochloris TaxID=1052 RepID=UPI001EE985F4|nr:ParB/RepB/Spo0J family partition protein [Halorhodospira halochloris]MCG5531331.1 ParB/RepB/Spo0J family partition protein [Halorhodospira halochloris]